MVEGQQPNQFQLLLEKYQNESVRSWAENCYQEAVEFAQTQQPDIRLGNVDTEEMIRAHKILDATYPLLQMTATEGKSSVADITTLLMQNMVDKDEAAIISRLKVENAREYIFTRRNNALRKLSSLSDVLIENNQPIGIPFYFITSLLEGASTSEIETFCSLTKNEDLKKMAAKINGSKYASGFSIFIPSSKKDKMIVLRQSSAFENGFYFGHDEDEGRKYKILYAHSPFEMANEMIVPTKRA